MTKQKIGYWLSTGLLAALFAFGGTMDLQRPPQMLQAMEHLGYPAYFLLILGAWKVAGAVAVLLPRTPWLKEWAYAGMFFDLTSASISHAASGDPTPNVVTPIVLTGLLVASYLLRPADRRLVRASEDGDKPASTRNPGTSTAGTSTAGTSTAGHAHA
ncbi:MAG TPA: DoxX family protein [Polyangiaceae bacterium]|nr:DoxX family protein [Polyangiaceae bacterium]